MCLVPTIAPQLVALFGGGLGAVALLEEIWRWTLRLKVLSTLFSLCVLPTCGWGCMLQTSLMPVVMSTCLPTRMNSYPSGTIKQNELSSLIALVVAATEMQRIQSLRCKAFPVMIDCLFKPWSKINLFPRNCFLWAVCHNKGEATNIPCCW